eukprot:COSAG05_NODE_227_length_13407_cov_32.277953_1_plen_72_part_00
MTQLEHGISAQSSTDDIWDTGMNSPYRGCCSHMGPYGAICGPYGATYYLQLYVGTAVLVVQLYSLVLKDFK